MKLLVEFGAQMLVKYRSAGPPARPRGVQGSKDLTSCFEAVLGESADPVEC